MPKMVMQVVLRLFAPAVGVVAGLPGSLAVGPPQASVGQGVRAAFVTGLRAGGFWSGCECVACGRWRRQCYRIAFIGIGCPCE